MRAVERHRVARRVRRRHQLLGARLPRRLADARRKRHRQRERAGPRLRRAAAFHHRSGPLHVHVSLKRRHQTLQVRLKPDTTDCFQKPDTTVVFKSGHSVASKPLLALTSGDAELHAGADQPQHDPRDRHPLLPRRRRSRIQDPDVAGRRRARGAAIAGDRQPADDHRPRAAERGRDDDHVALQQHRADRSEHRQDDDRHRRRVAAFAEAAPRHVGDERAEPGTDQRDADEVREHQQQRAADAADQRRDDHPVVLVTPIAELASIAPSTKP